MSLNKDSRHFDAFNEKSNLSKVFEIIQDISDRRGLGDTWRSIDGEIQDEIIEKWLQILDK